MKRRLLSLIIAFLLVATANAQTGDWQDVQNLSVGEAISVVTKHRRRCRFISATVDQLTCERLDGSPLLKKLRPMTFARTDIREVRIEHPDANTYTFTAAGAGTGAAVFVTHGGDGITPAGNALLGGIVGGAIGWIVGKCTSVIHGPVVYSR